MNLLAQFASVTTLVFDMDGVLTDGTLWLLSGQEWIRRMNIKDGYALQLAVRKGYRIAIISGSHSAPAEERLVALGIADIFQRVQDKKKQLNEYMQRHHLQKKQVLYMGDDIPDYEVMQIAGVACCPADAVAEVRKIAHYISPCNGGMGCVRDVVEKVLKLNHDWEINTTND